MKKLYFKLISIIKPSADSHQSCRFAGAVNSVSMLPVFNDILEVCSVNVTQVCKKIQFSKTSPTISNGFGTD